VYLHRQLTVEMNAEITNGLHKTDRRGGGRELKHIPSSVMCDKKSRQKRMCLRLESANGL